MNHITLSRSTHLLNHAYVCRVCVPYAHHIKSCLSTVPENLLNGKMSYRQTSCGLQTARLDVMMIVSLCNLSAILAALLPRCLSKFIAIWTVESRFSWLRDIARYCGKTSYRLVNRGPRCSASPAFPHHCNIWYLSFSLLCTTFCSLA